ncbi:unnamed protein product [Rhizopus stolonifer]
MLPEQRNAITKSLDIKMHSNFLKDEVILICRKIYKVLNDDQLSEDDLNDKIDKIKASSSSKDAKKFITIVSSFIDRYTSDSRQKEGEAKFIIEGLRPFLTSCITSPTKGAKYEWLTYHLLPHPTHPINQTMVPDFVLYVDPISTMNFELFLVEVKRLGNYSNGSFEKDLVKLGKEMQIALNKLVLHKVNNPVVVGLLIEGTKAVVFRMDLAYNGQYRMVELSRFHFLCNYVDDIWLVPAIMEKFHQIHMIIQQTLQNLYQAIQNEDNSRDISSYIRLPCGRPLVLKK